MTAPSFSWEKTRRILLEHRRYHNERIDRLNRQIAKASAERSDSERQLDEIKVQLAAVERQIDRANQQAQAPQ